MRSSLEVGDDDDDAADECESGASDERDEEEGNAEFSEFETDWRGDSDAFSARRVSMCMSSEPDKVAEKNGADETDAAAAAADVDDRDDGAPNKTRIRLRCCCR